MPQRNQPQPVVAISLLASFVLAVTGALAGPMQFTMELLPVPQGCHSYSLLHGLGPGRIVGTITCDDFATHRTVLWTDDGFVELGTFGGPSSSPYGLNARGEVVGTAETLEIYADEYYVSRPFLWDGVSLLDLGTLGGPLGVGAAISTRGTIVGMCQPAGINPLLEDLPPRRACVWDDGEVRDLGDLGGPEAWALDINGRGWVVGSSDTSEPLPSVPGFVHHAFLYDGEAMHDLGTLGGLASSAVALNERGDIVGWSLTGEGIERHAFLWRGGALYDLGTLGGPYSEAWDVNARGQIVGWSSPPPPDYPRAVLWDQQTTLDLNDLVVNREYWSLRRATAIDKNGRILVNALGNGQWRMALLVPTGGQ